MHVVELKTCGGLHASRAAFEQLHVHDALSNERFAPHFSSLFLHSHSHVFGFNDSGALHFLLQTHEHESSQNSNPLAQALLTPSHPHVQDFSLNFCPLGQPLAGFCLLGGHPHLQNVSL